MVGVVSNPLHNHHVPKAKEVEFHFQIVLNLDRGWEIARLGEGKEPGTCRRNGAQLTQETAEWRTKGLAGVQAGIGMGGRTGWEKRACSRSGPDTPGGEGARVPEVDGCCANLIIRGWFQRYRRRRQRWRGREAFR